MNDYLSLGIYEKLGNRSRSEINFLKLSNTTKNIVSFLRRIFNYYQNRVRPIENEVQSIVGKLKPTENVNFKLNLTSNYLELIIKIINVDNTPCLPHEKNY